jgi:hypothetical protein
MNLAKYTPHLWGAVGGAVVLAIVGFGWGGWVTGGSATKQIAAAQQEGRVSALAPLCAERFRAQADGATKVADLIKVNSWDRAALLEKGGWAAIPGGAKADTDVARACSELLAKPV